MRFGWQEHRESFHAIVHEVHHEQRNHLHNLILMMDFERYIRERFDGEPGVRVRLAFCNVVLGLPCVLFLIAFWKGEAKAM